MYISTQARLTSRILVITTPKSSKPGVVDTSVESTAKQPPGTPPSADGITAKSETEAKEQQQPEKKG